MTTFNSIPNAPDPIGSQMRSASAGASAGGGVRPGVSQATRFDSSNAGTPDVDVAQRLARKSAESLPETGRLLESIASDVSMVESIQQAAGTLSEAVKTAPAFDASGVSAALQTIQFALEQGREFAEKLKSNLPSLEKLEKLTPEAFANAPAAYAQPLVQVQTEAADTRKRLATLAEELGGRNQRIAARVESAASVNALTAALQAQSRKGLASVSLPPGGQSQVSSLLADLGLDRTAAARGASSVVPVSASAANAASANTTSTVASVNTLLARLQKQFPDAG